MRTLGFSAANDIFAEHAWYFRNALVRANYTNLQKKVSATTAYLEVFLRNLLLQETNELHNRNLHISGLFTTSKVDIQDEKVDIQDEKVDIQDERVDIQDKKADMETLLSSKTKGLSSKTKLHICRMFNAYGFDTIFGRSAIVELLALQNASASKLLSKLVQAGIIEPVAGHGKGKYRFSKMER